METKIQAWWFHLKAKLEILQYFSVYCTFLTPLTGFHLIFLENWTVLDVVTQVSPYLVCQKQDCRLTFPKTLPCSHSSQLLFLELPQVQKDSLTSVLVCEWRWYQMAANDWDPSKRCDLFTALFGRTTSVIIPPQLPAEPPRNACNVLHN